MERLGENFDLDQFVYAIKANQSVKHVCFSGTFVRELQDEHWRTMLGAVGHLVSLEELQIWCSTIPVSVFRETLLAAKGLRKLYFFRVTLAGDQEDFDLLAEALRDHPSLSDFRVGGFQTQTENANISLDCVVRALARTPRLQVVSLQLTGFQTPVPFSGEALASLFHSPTLTDLYLSRLGLMEEHFAVISTGIAESQTLKLLDLFGNNVDNYHVILIAQALEKNSTLETLVLPCPTEDLSMESCAAISQTLQVNKTLVTLNLPRSNLTDDGLLYITQGLTVNATLKKIEVGVSKNLGDKGMEALQAMLEKNYQLERLVLSSVEKSIKDKVEYYMRLNEVGRGSLLRDGKATREQWVEMLVAVAGDLDCLFYFLTMNPSLCQFANTRGFDVIITEEFKPVRRHTMQVFNDPALMGTEPSAKEKSRRASVF